MSDLNKIFLTGRLGDNPDLRYSPTGDAVANFDIAVNSGSGDNQTTDWFKIVAWKKQAENCANYLKKGSKVLVEGRVRFRSYETQDGQKRKVTEVIASHVQFLGNKDGQAPEPANQDDSGINLDDLPL
jgi:single-strand DNA-binding protein